MTLTNKTDNKIVGYWVGNFRFINFITNM